MVPDSKNATCIKSKMSHPKCPICQENIKILDKLVSDVSYLKATIASDLKLTRIIG